ncbi:MAG: YgjV family protein [Clostridia bacterium]|nr:YgjV family protein [Clostridia bacterium]
MFVVLGALSWHGPISAFVIVAKLITTVALGIDNPRIIRLLNFISLPCYLTYNIFMGSLSGMLSDSLAMASVVVGIVRLDILKQEKTAK